MNFTVMLVGYLITTIGTVIIGQTIAPRGQNITYRLDHERPGTAATKTFRVNKRALGICLVVGGLLLIAFS